MLLGYFEAFEENCGMTDGHTVPIPAAGISFDTDAKVCANVALVSADVCACCSA